MNIMYTDMLNSVETTPNTYVIKQNGVPVFFQVLYKGNFISILLKGKSDTITSDELLELRQTLKAGGKTFIAFKGTDWDSIKCELDGQTSNGRWTQLPNERYLTENYAMRFSADLERENGHLSVVKMPLFKEEELFGSINYLPNGMLPM